MPKSKNESLRRFASDPEARAYLLEALKGWFDFTQEVWVKDVGTGQRLRIDALSVCRSTNHIMGWEFKKSSLFKSEFCAALKQAMDYRNAVIDDDRLPSLRGQLVDACLVFPDWDGMHDNGEAIYSAEANGMRLLASHFRVGALSTDGRYGAGAFHIVIGEQAIWHSDRGWTGNAKGVLHGKRKRGSGRVFDSAIVAFAGRAETS